MFSIHHLHTLLHCVSWIAKAAHRFYVLGLPLNFTCRFAVYTLGLVTITVGTRFSRWLLPILRRRVVHGRRTSIFVNKCLYSLIFIASLFHTNYLNKDMYAA